MKKEPELSEIPKLGLWIQDKSESEQREMIDIIYQFRDLMVFFMSENDIDVYETAVDTDFAVKIIYAKDVGKIDIH